MSEHTPLKKINVKVFISGTLKDSLKIPTDLNPVVETMHCK
jgi:hypothetical protein